MVIAFDEISARIAKAFSAVGMSGENAARMANVLTTADARGVYSHGIQQVPFYLEMIERGIASADPEPKILREDSSMLLIDGDKGFGGIVVDDAVDMAAARARETGICSVGFTNIAHYGMGAYYVDHAAQQGMIGYLYGNADRTAAPFGGAEPYLGTNPYSFAAPAGKYGQVTLDMATTTTAWSKLYAAVQEGKTEVMPGCGVDRDGLPSTDPNEILYHGALSHFGGAKGYGIAFMVNMVCGILTGPLYKGGEIYCLGLKTGKVTISAFMNVIDIAHFIDPADFESRMEAFIEDIKAVKPAPGFSEVCYPGEFENRNCAKAMAEGVTIHDAAYENFVKAAAARGVTF